MQRSRVCVGGAVLVGALVFVGLVSPARGLVLHPDGAGPPASRPDDAALGRWVENASCVVVAPDYVLTTCHQGYSSPGYDVEIDGQTYQTAEFFKHHQADIRVVRITDGGDPPGLTYCIPPYTGTDETDYVAVIGGYGRGRDATLTTPPPGSQPYGYTWLNGSGVANDTLRWGTNAVDGTNGGGQTSVLVADFDALDAPTSHGPTPHEVALAQFDSGGGWFVNLGTVADPVWRLAGLCRSVDPDHGQDQESWFRDSVTGAPDPDYLDAVRVGAYAEWIDGVIHPHAWTADADGRWFDAANWAGPVPDAHDRWAAFGDGISADRTVTLDQAATIGTLRIDAGHAYRIAGSNILTFKSEDNVAGIEVNRLNRSALNGAHRVEVALWLRSPLVVNQCSAGDLTLAGGIFGLSGITKRGDGTVVLAAQNSFTGGVVIQEGTLGAAHTGALGSGDVDLTGGCLRLAYDTDAHFAADVTLEDGAGLAADALSAGTGRTLSVDTLTTKGNLDLTVTGGHGYRFGVTGRTDLSLVTGTVTVETASADLVLDGGVRMDWGTLNKTGPGALVLGGPLEFGSLVQMDVDGGTARFDADAGGAGSPPTLRVRAGGAAAEFDATQHLASLAFEAGGTGRLTRDAVTLVTGGLAVETAAGSALDLAGGSLVVDYAAASPFQDVEAYLASGYAGGHWDGPGLRSGAAAADPAGLTALGLLDNADPNPGLGGLTDLDGEPVDADAVLVAHTWYGDANLDGVVNVDDLNLLEQTWAAGPQPPGTDVRWGAGDFDYDGDVDIDDLNLLERSWALQDGAAGGSPVGVSAFDAAATGSLEAAVPASGGAVLVPAPTPLALLAAGLAVVAGRRCRARRRIRP